MLASIRKAIGPLLERILLWATYTVALVQLVIWTVPNVGLSFPVIHGPDPKVMVLIVNSLVLFVLVCSLPVLPSFQEANRTKYESSISASRWFLYFWYFLWIVWLALYVLRAWAEVAGTTENHAFHLAMDFLNLMTGAFLLLCYCVMVLPAIHLNQFGLLRLMFASVLSCAAFVLVEGILEANDFHVATILDGVQGFLVGVVLALFVGRLESRFLDSSRWIVASLYGYAILQFAYPIFATSDPRNPFPFLFIVSLALLLKVLLFWHVRELITSGKLIYYMFGYRQVVAIGNTDRDRVITELIA
jgi:hypothetical protein